jgi:hypothetical protein
MSIFHGQFILPTVVAVTARALNGISHNADDKLSNQSHPKTMVK